MKVEHNYKFEQEKKFRDQSTCCVWGGKTPAWFVTHYRSTGVYIG